MATVQITYHVRPRPSCPAVATHPTDAPPARADRILGQWADHVRREFGSSTTRETGWRRTDSGAYVVWRRQQPKRLVLAVVTYQQ